MKNLNIISSATLLTMLVGACIKQPEAAFIADHTSVLTGDTVKFTNYSLEAESFQWSFGDGNSSKETSPTYSYAKAGAYEVTMKAFSKKGKKTDDASVTILVTQPNEFQLDGTRYPLTHGMLTNHGNSNGTETYYKFELTLADDGISNSNVPHGIGNVVQLEMWSSSSSALIPGSYHYSSGKTPLSISYGSLILNFNTVSGTGTPFNVISGDITVSVSGLQYILEGTFTLQYGKILKIFYTGPLTYYGNPGSGL